MTRPTLGSLVATVIATAVALALPGAAYAQDYSFSDTCAGIDVAQMDPECTTSRIKVTVDDDGQVSWARESAYPRAAFEAFKSDIDGFDGTTEEYLDTAKDEVEIEPGASFTYELSDAILVVTIGMSMDIDSAEARELGVTSDGETIMVEFPVGPITDADSVTVTTPGAILESNGTIDGTSVTWSAVELETVAVLNAQGEATPQVDTTRWVVATAVVVVLAGLAAFYLLVWRRRAANDGESIDFEPEFVEGTDDGTTH